MVTIFSRVQACAPLWKNTNYQKQYLVQGRCHEVGYSDDVTFQKLYHPLETRRSPEEQVTKDNVYLKAMGQAGVSAEFFKVGAKERRLVVESDRRSVVET